MTPRLAAIIAVCVSLFLGGSWAGFALRGVAAERDLAECQRTNAEAMAIILRASRQAEADFRARERAWMDEREGIIDDANKELAVARRDADRVRAALERLRKQHADATRDRDAPANPAPGQGGEAAGAAADLPADVLLRLGDAAGELARQADEARAAGLACQRSYESLRAPRLGG